MTQTFSAPVNTDMQFTHRFELPARLPFDWGALIDFLRRRATPGVEVVSDNCYARSFEAGGGTQILSVTYEPSAARVRVTHSGMQSLEELLKPRIKRLFRLETDTGQAERFLGSQDRLRALVASQAGLRVPGAWDGFEVTIRAIIGQQISVAGATTLMGRLVHTAGRPNPAPSPFPLTHLFPSPAELLATDLSSFGVPRKRKQTLREVARLFAERGGEFLTQPDAAASLLSIEGIGKWTVGYILMRTGDESDCWPEGDLVLRKALSSGPEMITDGQLGTLFRGWSPYRSYATIHIWRNHAGSTD